MATGGFECSDRTRWQIAGALPARQNQATTGPNFADQQSEIGEVSKGESSHLGSRVDSAICGEVGWRFCWRIFVLQIRVSNFPSRAGVERRRDQSSVSSNQCSVIGGQWRGTGV